jgi:hypothetical protein
MPGHFVGLFYYYLFVYLFELCFGRVCASALVQPQGFSKDGTVALGSASITEDGKYVAYSVAKSGSDWQTIKVRVRLRVSDLSMSPCPWVHLFGFDLTQLGVGAYVCSHPQDIDTKQDLPDTLEYGWSACVGERERDGPTKRERVVTPCVLCLWCWCSDV